MAEKEPKYKDREVFCSETKKHLHLANLLKLDGAVKKMSKYGESADWEWFAESFANSQNVIDDRDFEKDPKLSDEENAKRQELLDEARIVGFFAEQIASRFRVCASQAPPS